ncbi:MAG: GntR family transcriptional regulator [Candidatus Dormibacteraeota bacterium]|nr:GntR family transcriptional regulator [Candidatus Dormibacteraeota bacterium]
MTEVARRFCADARKGRMAPDAHVRVRDLMESYGASRAAAQGTIAILRRQGLLVPDLRGRLMLRLPTRSDVREIMALRIALETLVLEIGVERLSDADLERMRASIVRLRTAIVDSRWDMDRAVTTAFNTLARVTRSPMLLRMISDLHHESRSYRALLEDLLGASTNIREADHLEEMWRAVAARDVTAACRLHRTHIELLGEWVLERLPNGT